eukprot:scaffold65438_cov72-Phaeocystis_antarctica.AAC.2
MPSNVAKRPEKTVHISQVILPKVATFVVSSAGHFLSSRSIVPRLPPTIACHRELTPWSPARLSGSAPRSSSSLTISVREASCVASLRGNGTAGLCEDGGPFAKVKVRQLLLERRLERCTLLKQLAH